MTLGGRPALIACVAAVALLVAGCSSGGGKHSASPATTTSVTPVTNTGPPLGKCRAQSGDELSKALNVGVPGLAIRLVPITALTVRVCDYPTDRVRGQRFAMLTRRSTVAHIEDETNRLPTLPQRSRGMSCGANARAAFVTFATGTQQVDVIDFCGAVTNGIIVAKPATTLFNELLRYTNPATY